MWGRLITCGRLAIGPAARPGEFLDRTRQPGPHGIRFDIASDSQKLRLVTNQPIVAFFLPERLSGLAEDLVSLPGGESLERLHHLGNGFDRRHQEMNVVRHDGIRVELIISQVSILNRRYYSARDLGQAERERTGSGRIENAVHCEKGLSGSIGRREAAICREAARETPCEKNRLADGIIVRKAPAVELRHKPRVTRLSGGSQADCQSAAG